MAARVRVVKKKIGSASTLLSSVAPAGITSDLSAQLNNCLFERERSLRKFVRIINNVQQFARMLATVRDAGVFASISQPQCDFARKIAQYDEFVARNSAQLFNCPTIPPEVTAICTADDTQKSVESFIDAKLFAPPTPPETKEAFLLIYEEARESAIVREIIQTCDIIAPYKVHIKDATALTGTFLENIPGSKFAPFANLDIADAYLQAESLPPDARKGMREFILIFVHKLFTYGYQLFTIYTAPDMNVEQMIAVVHDSISQLRSVPQLSRCDIAFDTIEKSIHLLRDNFGSYYVDFLQTKSPSTIFENFILDVAKQQSTATSEAETSGSSVGGARREQSKRRREKVRNAKLTHQFNDIIRFYQDQVRAQGASANSRMANFDHMFDQYQQIQSHFNLQHLGRAETSGSSAPATSQ